MTIKFLVSNHGYKPSTWTKNGIVHRDNGAAIIYTDGRSWKYINGKMVY